MRIILNTFGSLGDLHPFVAIALSLKDRGHRPVIATSANYRLQIEALGIEFAHVRPDFDDFTVGDLIKRVMNRHTGSVTLLREMVLPELPNSYADLMSVSQGADLLVGHPITFATRLVAEKKGIPWASTTLAPVSMWSAYDPSALPSNDWTANLRWFGPKITRLILERGKATIAHWGQPIEDMRAILNLPADDQWIFDGQFSPHLNLALFSKVLGAPQPDWPVNSKQTGFCFFDRVDGAMSPQLDQFLSAGPPPVVFTLGSSAVWDAGDFYQHSIAAAVKLGVRAVLLIGKDVRNVTAETLPEGIAAFDYAPYSEIFPRASAIVHQGGVGTTGQALRAGKPMLIMPYSHDQPDNALRCKRLGVALSIDRDKYTAQSASRLLGRLIDERSFAEHAKAAAEVVRSENGPASAADELLSLLT